MSRATGLADQRFYQLDASAVLVGAVGAWENRSAATRTGAAQLLDTKLNCTDILKFVGVGQSSNSAGGYVISVGHVARGAALSTVTNWVEIGRMSFSASATNEIAITGRQIEALVRAGTSPTITGDCRVTAIKAVAGLGTLSISNIALTTNVATITVGTHAAAVGDTITVTNCSNSVFNGTYVVTAVAATTISYDRTNANITSTSGTGSVTNGVAAPVGTNTLYFQYGA
jgi:hypothetical protein